VENEVEAALEEEEQTRPQRRTVLVPIKIDDAVEDTNQAWARTIKRTRHVGDFTHWEDNDAYQEEQLLGNSSRKSFVPIRR
jgi:hypothetical protein